MPRCRRVAGVELKQRLAVDERGYEKWAKSKLASLPPAPSGLPEWIRTARVTVSKRRSQALVGTGPLGPAGVLIEQTDLEVAIGESRQRWRSVAVEGKRKACEALRPQVAEAAASQAVEGSLHVGGYPSWVLLVATAVVGAGAPSSTRAREEGRDGDG